MSRTSKSKKSRSKTKSRQKTKSRKSNKKNTNTKINVYKGKIALCFLVTRNLKNQDLWDKWVNGYEEYINIYSHLSGPDITDKSKWDPFLWDGRIERTGIKAIPTKWGTTSLIHAEGLTYEAALKDSKENKYMCILSESCIPLWTFPEFYNRIFKYPKKSYLQTETMRGGDDDLFLDCFPEKLIPSTKKVKSRSQRDLRNWNWKKTHQWKVLNIWGAKEFVNMIHNKEWMDAYTNCFRQLEKDDPRLAADEISYPNWIILKHGPKAINKHFRNYESTFVDFSKAGIHAKDFNNITPKVKDSVCEHKPFFARKFPTNPKLMKQIPVKCNSFGIV